MIRQAITRAIAIRPARSGPGAHDRDDQKADRTSRALVRSLARAASEEIPKRMDIPVAKVRKVLKIAGEPFARTPIGEEEDSHLGDFIEDRQVVSPADAVINLNLRRAESVLRRSRRARRRCHIGSAWATAASTRSGSGPELRRDPRADPADRTRRCASCAPLAQS